MIQRWATENNGLKTAPKLIEQLKEESPSDSALEFFL